MERQNFIEQLKLLGFNEYKSKVFLVLLCGKIMSASEIAKEAKIIRSSIYDILKSFVEKGYINEIETNRILQYQIIDPNIILDKIEKEYHTSHNLRLTQLKKTFNSLKSFHNNGELKPDNNINIELIRGYNKHRISKYLELLKDAKKEILGMYRFKGLVMAESDEIARQFLKKGGVIKSIYQISLDFKIQHGSKINDANPDDLLEVTRKFEKNGEQIKLSNMDIPNITVIDGENVFINADDKHIPRQSQADIIFRKSNIAKNFIDLFNFYWDKSLTLNQFENSLQTINNK